MNLGIIPTAEVLKSAMIDNERAKRQEKGLKAISVQLHKINEVGLHEITLYQDYMIKNYSLDVLVLKKVFEDKGYNVTTTKDGYGYTDSIVIKW